MVKNVKVIATDTNEVLFETELNNISKAYEYASSMEQLGIDIKVVSPTLTETLVNSLGLNLDDQQKYSQSVKDELHDHDGSCCSEEIKS